MTKESICCEAVTRVKRRSPTTGAERALVLLVLGLTAACGDSAPIEPVATEIQPGVVAGASGCYTIDVQSHSTGVYPVFSGDLSGDLIGTEEVVFDFAEIRFDGRTIKNQGIVTWHIEGGIVPELIGTTFRAVTTPMNVLTPNSDQIVRRARAMDDFPAKANLTLAGVFNPDNTPPPFAVNLEYKGVICP